MLRHYLGLKRSKVIKSLTFLFFYVIIFIENKEKEIKYGYIWKEEKKEITFKCKCSNAVTTTKYDIEESYDTILHINHITYSTKCGKCKEIIYKYETVRD